PKRSKYVEAPKYKHLVNHRDLWTLTVDGSSTGRSGGIRVFLKIPSRAELEYAITLDFKVANNEAEYEALLVGLRMAKSLEVKKI
ncbi:hypothetical protein QT467_22405, partial [Xanthomonas citri pv. citri]